MWKIKLEMKEAPDKLLVPLKLIDFIVSQRDVIAVVKKKPITINRGCGARNRYLIYTPFLVRGGLRLFPASVDDLIEFAKKAEGHWWWYEDHKNELTAYRRALPYGEVWPYLWNRERSFRIAADGYAVFRRVTENEYKISADREYDAVMVRVAAYLASRTISSNLELLEKDKAIGYALGRSACATDSTADLLAILPPSAFPVHVIERTGPYRGDPQYKLIEIRLVNGIPEKVDLGVYPEYDLAVQAINSSPVGEDII